MTIETRSPNAIATDIYNFILCQNYIDTKKLLAIGCNGTAVKTGSKGAVIRLIELKLDTPLDGC